MDVIFEKNAIRKTFCGIYFLSQKSIFRKCISVMIFWSKKKPQLSERKAPLLMLSPNFEIQRLAPK